MPVPSVFNMTYWLTRFIPSDLVDSALLDSRMVRFINFCFFDCSLHAMFNRSMSAGSKFSGDDLVELGEREILVVHPSKPVSTPPI